MSLVWGMSQPPPAVWWRMTGDINCETAPHARCRPTMPWPALPGPPRASHFAPANVVEHNSTPHGPLGAFGVYIMLWEHRRFPRLSGKLEWRRQPELQCTYPAMLALLPTARRDTDRPQPLIRAYLCPATLPTTRPRARQGARDGRTVLTAKQLSGALRDPGRARSVPPECMRSGRGWRRGARDVPPGEGPGPRKRHFGPTSRVHGRSPRPVPVKAVRSALCPPPKTPVHFVPTAKSA